MPTGTSPTPLVLVVDDDESVRRSIEKTLSRDLEIRTAEDGAQALTLLETDGLRPDLVLLDVRMPGPSGHEVCMRMQEDPELAQIPVVFVTVLDGEQDRRKALEVGAVGFLSKPFEQDDLRRVVDEHLANSRRWRQLEEPSTETPEGSPDEDVLDRLGPQALGAFKESLTKTRELSEEARQEVDRLPPDRLYELAPLLELTEEKVARHLADFLELEYRPRILADDVAMGKLPRAFCRTHSVVPLEDDAVALANPFDLHLLDSLRRSVWDPNRSTLVLAAPALIRGVFDQRSSDDESQGQTQRVLRLERPEEGEASPAQRRASEVLRSAISEGASDVHFEPKDQDTLVRFRIDGEMEDVRTLSKEDTARILSRLKALANMDIAERRKPQDGSVKAILGSREFKLRLATSSTAGGESLVVRILEPDADPVPLGKLGFTQDQAQTLREAAKRSQGMILVVGPTGSGKSTTVFTLLSEVDATGRSLLSVEDPVEYTIPAAKQQEVNARAGLTFESLLKSAMRQDPDILFLGEVRDSFSANAVLDFASSGHLTISTLHSANATTTIFRLERLGVERGAMADALSVIVAQKLLRVLCPECKKVGPPTPEEMETLAPFSDSALDEVARAVGCPSCRDTGYEGRTAVGEVLSFDSEVADRVRRGDGVQAIRAFCAERGDVLISDHAVAKVRELLVPVEDVARQILSEAKDHRSEPSNGRSGQEAADPQPAQAESSEGEADGGGDGATILVVEDERGTRMMIQRFLETAGYRVITADDGVEALMQLGKGEVDAVVSDVGMPNMSGEDLLRLMREKKIDSPVLFVTGGSDEGLESRLLGQGARDFIRKPVESEVLLARLANALEKG